MSRNLFTAWCFPCFRSKQKSVVFPTELLLFCSRYLSHTGCERVFGVLVFERRVGLSSLRLLWTALGSVRNFSSLSFTLCSIWDLSTLSIFCAQPCFCFVGALRRCGCVFRLRDLQSAVSPHTLSTASTDTETRTCEHTDTHADTGTDTDAHTERGSVHTRAAEALVSRHHRRWRKKVRVQLLCC